MKYYAVTEDPRELYHYGVKGMKWGQHIFGDKPKSPGYHKAVKKLKAVKASTISKSSEKQIKAAQKDYNRRAKQEAKYLKAVQKAQFKNNMVEALHNFDKEDSYRKSLVREQKAAKINEVLANVRADRELRNLGKSIKSEKKFDKYMQQAREGSLRYGNLSEDQIRKVQERLNLEDQTRRLGGKEKPFWREQKKEARRAGKLQGITRATAAVSEEVARGVAQFGIQGLSNRIMMKSAAKHEGEYQKARDTARSKRTRKDLERELNEEVMRAEIRDPSAYDNRKLKVAVFGKSEAQRNAEKLKAIEEKNEQKRFENDRKQLVNEMYRKWALGDKNGNSNDNILERIDKISELNSLLNSHAGRIELPDQNKQKKDNGPRLFENGGNDDVWSPVRTVGKKIDSMYLKVDPYTKAFRRKMERLKATKKYITRG